MAEKKSLVEDAILQMKNLEEAIAENAKGTLASTMGQEIKELVKESLNETEVGEDADMEVDMTDMSMDNEDSEEEMDSDEDEMESDEDEMDSEEDEMDSDTIDLTKSSDEDVLKVFQLMEPTDSFVVTKDESGNIHLKDEDKEYMIVQEGEEMESEMEEEYSEMDEEMEETMHSEMDEVMDEVMDSDSSIEEIVADVFGDSSDDGETIYEIEMDDAGLGMGDKVWVTKVWVTKVWILKNSKKLMIWKTKQVTNTMIWKKKQVTNTIIWKTNPFMNPKKCLSNLKV